jgi:two-component system sensor histidine kinase CiaH
MKELWKATVQLTIKYSLIFFAFIWLFSGGIYVWVNNSLGEGYVNRINSALEQQHSTSTQQVEISDNTASVAADVTLDRLRNILLAVNAAALFAVPLVAYIISKQTLMPIIESQKSQQRFVANASHELRTPLAVMLAELDWADKKSRSVAEYQSTITNTKNEVQHMNSLVTTLLMLAQLSNKVTLAKEPMAIDSLIQEAVARSEKTATARSLHFKTNFQAHTVMGDEKLLGIVFHNLLDNAIKYAKSNTTIDIETQTTNNTTTIAFRNETDHISSNQLAHLFDRFYQGETHQAGEGFGLGLAITKQIIEAHGGSIDVRYTAKNHQIEIWISLTQQ